MASLDQLFTFEITCSKCNTAMATLLYLTAVSVSCLLFAPVTGGERKNWEGRELEYNRDREDRP